MVHIGSWIQRPPEWSTSVVSVNWGGYLAHCPSANPCPATLQLAPANHSQQSDLVVVNPECTIISFQYRCNTMADAADSSVLSWTTIPKFIFITFPRCFASLLAGPGRCSLQLPRTPRGAMYGGSSVVGRPVGIVQCLVPAWNVKIASESELNFVRGGDVPSSWRFVIKCSWR